MTGENGESQTLKKLAVITGATGLLGSNLAIELLSQGFNVRATKRPSSKIQHLSEYAIEWVNGDVGNKDSLVAAFKDADVVFHCAAAVDLILQTTENMILTNVEGTRNVIEAVVQQRSSGKSPRLVYCSSVVTVGVADSPDEPADETHRWNFDEWKLNDGYTVTKTDAENLVKKALQDDAEFDAVIVNPTYIIGENDIGPSSGLMITTMKEMPVIPPGRSNFVDVKDVARGFVSAYSKGRRGERYILSGHNMKYEEFIITTCKLLNISPPKMKLPYSLSFTFALFGEAKQYFSGKEQSVNITKARWGYCENWVFKCDKAKQELQYEVSPIEPAIQRAIDWFRKHDMLK
ncbi:NAD+-dependent farnesol dehydrogenase FLDH [Acrasis kona]|uniref:NAD+-dependent farnesol dehydrogenase FLDH n=1 Tax=Acrasis kona TaxID=1008807 RepID=A0AAW2ZH37_9EUKA